MSVLAATQVSVTRGDRTILRNVTLTAETGELVALVGPNGAGKSTLLAALSHDMTPTTGTVTMLDRPLTEWNTTDLARTRAVLPQTVTVAFPFQVIDIVRMGRAPYFRRPEAAHDDAVVAAVMDEMGITDLADRRHPSLSGGEQARVAMARVLAQATPIVLLDEPTAALDVKFQENVLAAITRRVRTGTTAVVVLHDLGLAAAYATRVVLLADGEIAADGSPKKVLNSRQLSRVYDTPIEVVAHPKSGATLIAPRRS